MKLLCQTEINLKSKWHHTSHPQNLDIIGSIYGNCSAVCTCIIEQVSGTFVEVCAENMGLWCGIMMTSHRKLLDGDYFSIPLTHELLVTPCGIIDLGSTLVQIMACHLLATYQEHFPWNFIRRRANISDQEYVKIPLKVSSAKWQPFCYSVNGPAFATHFIRYIIQCLPSQEDVVRRTSR